MATVEFVASAEAWTGGGYEAPPFVTNIAVPSGDLVIMVQNGDEISDYTLTVDGVSATRVFNNTTGEKRLVVFTISSASATTKTFSIGGGAYISRLLLAVYKTTGLDITAISDSAVGPFAYVDPGPKATDDPLVVPTEGLGLAMGVNDGSGAITWNNGTPINSVLAYGSSKQITFASFASGSSLNPSITPPAPYQGTAIVGVSFAPAAGSGITGSASGTLPLNGLSSGTARIAGAASGSLPLSGSASGKVRTTGISSGTFGLSGLATGTTRVAAVASGTLPLSGMSAGTVQILAASSGTIALTGLAVGAVRTSGSALGTLPLTGSASGTSTNAISGVASGTLPLSGSSTATTAIIGHAAGILPLTGGSTGLAVIVGAASGALPLDGHAAGTSHIAGMAVGTFDLTGSAAGTVIGAISGTAAGVLPLIGSAIGTVTIPVPIPAARIITPLAQQTVLTPDAQSAIVTPPQRCCTIILAGYEEVFMSSEYFQWPDKLAPAVIIYGVDWARRLGEATIVSHNFELVSGSVTLTPRAPNGTETSVEIAGGTAGSIAVIIASAVASDGEIHAIRVSIDIA